MSFLAIDIGNTRLKWALYATPHPGAVLLQQGAVFLEAIDELADGDWKVPARAARMLGCVVAGDAVRRRVEEQMELWDLEPRWVVPSAHGAGVSTATTTRTAWAPTAGWRWSVRAGRAGAAAAVPRTAAGAGGDGRHRGDGGRAGRDGRFLGGLILPGFGLMLKALEMGTAGLRVPTGEVVDFPTNTSDA
jgi:type III pantothenate kinase